VGLGDEAGGAVHVGDGEGAAGGLRNVGFGEAALAVPPIAAGSLVPVIVTVISRVVPSALAAVKLSV
jgi:hypothetical protein